MRTDQAKRLKALEDENRRLKQIVANKKLDKAILREPASGYFWVRRSVVGPSSMCVMHLGETSDLTPPDHQTETTTC